MSFELISNLKDRLVAGFDRVTGREANSGTLQGHTVKMHAPEDTAVGRLMAGRVVPGTRSGPSYRGGYYSIGPSRPFTAVSGVALGITLLIFAVALVILGMA